MQTASQRPAASSQVGSYVLDVQPVLDGVSVVIPAYNEENAIARVLNDVLAVLGRAEVPFEVILVDDGSTDRTAEIARAAGIQVISHDINRGYGAALKSGIRAARHEIVAIVDADGTYPIDAIPRLLSEIPQAEMVVAARTGASVSIPLFRRPAKWVLGRLANYLSGRKIPDLNSGLRVIRRSTLVPFARMLPDGFSFTSTITLAMLTNGYRVAYVPIDYYRRQGSSKINPVRELLNFLQLIIRTVLYFDPLKIFVPASLSFFLAGLLLLAYRLLTPERWGLTIVVLCVTGVQLLALGMIADLINKRLR